MIGVKLKYESKYWVRTIFLLLLFLYSLHIQSQSIFQRHYTTKDGLPSNQVFDMEEDEKGRLWLATDNGLCYFDGVDFTPITSDPKIDDAIYWLYKKDDTIWCISLDGQLQYIKNGKIFTYKGNHLITKNQKVRIYSGFSIQNETIYYSIYSYGLKSINPEQELDTIRTSTLSKNDTIWKFNYQLNDEIIPYSKYTSKDAHSLSSCITFQLRDTTFTYSFPGNHLHKNLERSIKIGKDKWLRSNEECLYELSNNGVKILHVYDHRINSLLLANDGSIWIGFIEGGVKIYKNGAIKEDNFIHLLPRSSVCSIYEDSYGNIWCSTLEKGVYCSINCDAILIDNIDPYHYQDIIKHKNYYLALSSNGELTKIEHESISKIPSPNENQVYYWLEQYDDKVFIGGQKKEKRYVAKSNDYKYQLIHSIDKKHLMDEHLDDKVLIDQEDSVLIKMYGGNAIWLTTDNIQSFHQSNFFAGRTDNILQESINTFWRSNGSSLLRFENGTYTEANLQDSELRILDIKRITDNLLALATKQKGLCIYNEKLDSLIPIYHNPVGTIVSIAQIDSTLWACSNKLVYQFTFSSFDPIQYEISKFDEYDGITNENMKKILVDDEYIWLLTDLGINRIKSDRLQNKVSKPSLFFTDILSNGTPISQNRDHSLLYNKNRITFNYSSIDLTRKSNITYYYQLEGFHDNYQSTENNSIEFSSLPPGKYNLKIYAYNGRYKSNILQFSFVIESPIWTSWYWILLLIILIVAIFSTIVRTIISIKLKRKLKNEENEREKLKLKLKALKAQMNPHFMFNSLNSIQYYILENDSQSAAKYLSKFSSLIRLILEESDVDRGKLSNELKMIQLYLELEQLRLENKFDFEINIAPNINPHIIAIPSLLIQPIIENSVWHGMTNKKEKGKIIVDFEIKDKHIICSVMDNGIGREKAREFKRNDQFRKSMGMSISRERLKLLHSKIQKDVMIKIIDLTDNGNSTGTKVILTIPLVTINRIGE